MIDEIDILGVLRRHIWMIVLLGLVAAPAGFVGSLIVYPERFTATALVLVRPQQDIKLDSRHISKEFLDFPIGLAQVETPSKTYIEIIKSPEFIGRIVRELSLDKEEPKKPGFLSKLVPESIRPAFEDFKTSVKAMLKDALSFVMYGRVIPKDAFAEAVKDVKDDLKLEARSETYIFTIMYTAKSAQEAADVANVAAKLFINFMEELRLSEGQYNLAGLRAELGKSQRQLEVARRQLEAFKNAHSVFRYEAEHDAQLRLIADLKSELAKLDETAAGLAAVSNQTTASTSSVSLTARRESLLGRLRTVEAELKPLPALEHQLKQLVLAEKVALTAYETIEKVFQEVEIKNSYAKREAQLVTDAVPPQKPSGPTRLVFALVSLLGAVLVGVSLAFLLEYLNRRVRGIRDVEDVVGLKVLATIPRVPRRRWRLVGL